MKIRFANMNNHSEILVRPYILYIVGLMTELEAKGKCDSHLFSMNFSCWKRSVQWDRTQSSSARNSSPRQNRQAPPLGLRSLWMQVHLMKMKRRRIFLPHLHRKFPQVLLLQVQRAALKTLCSELILTFFGLDYKM